MIASAEGQSRSLTSSRAEDLYLTLMPDGRGPAAEAAKSLYTAVAKRLRASGARIFAERVFATREAMAIVEAERRACLGELDDGVAPTRIVVTEGRAGPFAGVQIHAVSGGSSPLALRGEGDGAVGRGRELRIGEDRWLAFCEVSPSGDVSPGEQSARMFEHTGRMLRQAGADMRSVARTWLWLDNICSWYNDLNAARTAFFRREGLIGEGAGRPRLPASTGIGLGNATGSVCVLDLVALPGREESIRLLETGGEQRSAFAYGSAFSRAAIAPMPGGATLFISGTAAIDAEGRTEHVGQIDRQIESTLHHVRSLLAKAGCGDGEVLSALVYCKTREVEDAFARVRGKVSWPLVSMIAEVCRPDLLFEVELTAGPAPGAAVEG